MKQLRVDIGEYPLRAFRMAIPSDSTSHRRTKSPLRWIQYLFLLVGLVSASVYGWLYAEARVYQEYQGWRLDQIVKHRPADLGAFLASYLVGSATKVAKEPPAPANGSEPSRKFSPGPPLVGSLIGRIEIPRLGLSSVVLEGDSDQVLRKGVGHIPSTSLPGRSGNVAIAGHRDTFFRALKDIRRNDNITLVTATSTYHYRVRSVQVVRPNDTKVLAPSDHASLTLVTCYPFHFVGSAPKRYIVQARQIRSSSGVVKQGPCQTQRKAASDAGAEGCPTSATVLQGPELGRGRPSLGGRPDLGRARVIGVARDPVLYELKTALQEIPSLIWRRIQIWENATVAHLREEWDQLNAWIAAALASYIDEAE